MNIRFWVDTQDMTRGEHSASQTGEESCPGSAGLHKKTKKKKKKNSKKKKKLPVGEQGAKHSM